MDPSALNPFAVLSFIVAPAVLTNASSVMALGTSNRFARAIDRARQLTAMLESKTNDADRETSLRIRQLKVAERRALLLVRALTAYYVSVGSFAAASLFSLGGAILFLAAQGMPHYVALAAALVSGVIGVGGLVCGSTLLVWETRMTLAILWVETDLLLERVGPPAEGRVPNK